MNTDFLNGWPVELIVTFRLLVAYALGGIIGWDRERDGQAAGLRTHMLVALGSAGFTLVFIYGFPNASGSDNIARAISQIIAGVGFLGAGVIWQTGGRVRGITTAAGIWVIAAVGMLAGVGMWFLAVLLTVLCFITLHFLQPQNEKLKHKHRRKALAAGQPLKDNDDDDDEDDTP